LSIAFGSIAEKRGLEQFLIPIPLF